MSELKNKMRQALYLTNAAYLMVDAANTFAADCDIVLSSMQKAFNREDKQKIKYAYGLAVKLRHALHDAGSPFRDIKDENAPLDSDYIYNVIKLVIDRTSDTEAGRKLVFDKLHELPSVLEMEKDLYIETPKFEDIGETEEQRKFCEIESEFNEMMCKYRNAQRRAEDVAKARATQRELIGKRVNVHYKTQSGEEGTIEAFYYGVKFTGAGVILDLMKVKKDGTESRVPVGKCINISAIVGIEKVQ